MKTETIDLLMKHYADLNTAKSAVSGRKSSDLANSLRFLQKKINESIRETDGKESLDAVLDAYVKVVKHHVGSYSDSHHMIDSSIRFLQSTISKLVKGKI